MSELTKVLDGLSVVAADKMASRVSWSKQKENPTLVKILLKKPNALETALWDITQAKVKAIALRQRVTLPDQIKHRIITS